MSCSRSCESRAKNSFKGDPPNAALSIVDPHGQPMQVVVALNNPRLDGKNIQYDARVLRSSILPTGAGSNLFIDGYGTPCNLGASTPAFSDYPCLAATAFSQAKTIELSSNARRCVMPRGWEDLPSHAITQ
jgi:hypothetical protein